MGCINYREIYFRFIDDETKGWTSKEWADRNRRVKAYRNAASRFVKAYGSEVWEGLGYCTAGKKEAV